MVRTAYANVHLRDDGKYEGKKTVDGVTRDYDYILMVKKAPFV